LAATTSSARSQERRDDAVRQRLGWLVENGGKLEIAKTPNAETPLTTGKKALITIDVWEHAYYLDFPEQARRLH
jgi:superoxide dismutase